MKRRVLPISLLGAMVVMSACGGSSAEQVSTAAPIVVESIDGGPAASAKPATDGAAPAPAPGGDTAPTATDGAGSAVAGAGASGGTDEEKALAFAKCMRDNGVDFPDPTVAADGSVSFGLGAGGAGAGGAGGGNRGGGLRGNPEFRAAQEACSDLLAGASFLPSRDEIDGFQDQLLEVAQCLRDEGIEVDDPNFSAGGQAGGSPFGPNFDPQDPATAEAIEACQGLLNGALPGDRS
jgi:hypothetical protein